MEIAGRGIGSIVIGGRLLAALASAGRPLMLRDIAAQSDLTPAQAHAYLVSFRKIGLVEQVNESGLYQLGPFALQLGLARMRSVDALRLATQAAPAFAAEMGFMITVAVWGSLGATVVQTIEAGDQVHVNLRAGTVYSLLHTATGRIFAAFLPKEVVEANLKLRDKIAGLLEPANAETTTDLPAEVERSRERGYATALGSPIPGVNAIAAPVFDHTGQIKLAITLIGPAALVDVALESDPVRRLVGFAKTLSSELGFTPEAVEAAPAAINKLRSPSKPGARRRNQHSAQKKEIIDG
jgi:DNA-binding IclR family transcriptional regulator